MDFFISHSVDMKSHIGQISLENKESVFTLLPSTEKPLRVYDQKGRDFGVVLYLTLRQNSMNSVKLRRLRASEISARDRSVESVTNIRQNGEAEMMQSLDFVQKCESFWAIVKNAIP